MIDTLHDMNVCKMFSADVCRLCPSSSIGTRGCSSTLVADAGSRGRTGSHQTHPNLYFQLHSYQWKLSHYTNLGNQNTPQDKSFLFFFNFLFSSSFLPFLLFSFFSFLMLRNVCYLFQERVLCFWTATVFRERKWAPLMNAYTESFWAHTLT